MEKVNYIAELLYKCTVPDNKTREAADNEIRNLREQNPIEFLNILYFLIQNSNKVSVESISLAFILARRSFKEATKIKETEDASENYKLISIDIANEFANYLLSFLNCSEPSFVQHASLLFGQIVVYLLNFNENDPILDLICQDIIRFQGSYGYCNALLFILEEYELSQQRQVQIFEVIQKLLFSNDCELKMKSLFIKILGFLISALSNILTDQVQCRNFLERIFSLLHIPELKADVYEYFSNIGLIAPSLFGYMFDLLEQSISDMENNEQNEDVIMSSFHMWKTISDVCYNEMIYTDELISFSQKLIPLFLHYAEMIPDLNTIDTIGDNEVHIEARECIRSFVFALRNPLIQALLQFGSEMICSGSPAKHEVGIFCLSMSVITKDEDIDISPHIVQFIEIIKNGLGGSIRIIDESLKFLNELINYAPELEFYNQFIDVLIQLLETQLCNTSLDVLGSISLASNIDPKNIYKIVNALLSVQSSSSIECCIKFVNNFKENYDFIENIINKTIAIIELCDQNTDIDYLSSLVDLLSALVNYMNTGTLVIVSRLMYELYRSLDLYNCLFLISSIANKTNNSQYMQDALHLVMNHIKDKSETTILVVASAICLFCSKWEITKGYLHEIMQTFYDILNMDMTEIAFDTKTTILEAINGLHVTFPKEIQPYFNKLITIYQAALYNIKDIDEYDKELGTTDSIKLLTAIIESVILFTQEAINSNNVSVQQICIQISFICLQDACELSSMNSLLALEVFELIELLCKFDKSNTRQFIFSNEKLMDLMKEAEMSPDKNVTEKLQTIISILQCE